MNAELEPHAPRTTKTVAELGRGWPLGRHIARLLTAGAAFVALSTTAGAQEPALQKPLRFDLTPLIGYRTAASFPIQPYVTGRNPRVTMDAAPSSGFAFGVRLNEDDLVEFRWARESSYARVEGIDLNATPQRATLNQFHGDFSHEYTMENWAAWARPYVMLSVGASHLSGTSNTSITRFSFGVGGGVKFLVKRHFGFRLQGEWLPIFMDPYGTVICGAGCVVHIGGTLASQGEVTVGPMFQF